MPYYTPEEMTLKLTLSPWRVKVLYAWVRAFKYMPPVLWRTIGKPVALGPLKWWLVRSLEQG